jgi:hypothetical protein
MRHGFELYFMNGVRELGDFEDAGGLDRFWRVALGMMQFEDLTPCRVEGILWR